MNELGIFGYVARGASSATRERMTEFVERLGRATKMDLSTFEGSSYVDLATALSSGYVDVAWLPPIPLVRLESEGVVVPLVAHRRRGDFHSALIVRRDSKIESLAQLSGARAAWVDPDSASGFVMARIGLGAAGLDPRGAFSEERFFSSHEGVARAVLRGRADVGATYAGREDDETTRGAWLDLEDDGDQRVRILARFGGIPNDATVGRAGLPPEQRERLTEALIAMSKGPKHRALLRRVFGVEGFARLRSTTRTGYEKLRKAVEAATRSGLLAGPQ